MFDMLMEQILIDIGGIILVLILIGVGIGYFVRSRVNIKKDS